MAGESGVDIRPGIRFQNNAGGAYIAPLAMLEKFVTQSVLRKHENL